MFRAGMDDHLWEYAFLEASATSGQLPRKLRPGAGTFNTLQMPGRNSPPLL